MTEPLRRDWSRNNSRHELDHPRRDPGAMGESQQWGYDRPGSKASRAPRNLFDEKNRAARINCLSEHIGLGGRLPM